MIVALKNIPGSRDVLASNDKEHCVDKRDDLKRKLLEASIRIFLRKGYAGTTVNEIATSDSNCCFVSRRVKRLNFNICEQKT